MIRTIARKLAFLFRRARFDQELSEEMQLHIDLRAQRLRDDQGAEPAGDAQAAARRRFGNPTVLLEASRDIWIWRWLEDGWTDLRFAARILRKRSGFTAVAAATLALDIGATTAVFSIVEAVLLRPLPYRDPDRLVAIWDRGLREKSLQKIFASYTDYEEWSRHARSFETLAAATWAYSPSRILTNRGPAKQVLAIPVTASFFDTLGVPATLGRTFTPEDERHGCSVVLSDAFWNTALGGDRAIAGAGLTLDQRECTVLGVMPPGFSFYPPAAQMWILLGPDFEPPREKAVVGIFARLKPGVTREQAQAEVAALHRASHPSGFWSGFEPAVYDLHGEFNFLASRTLRITLIVTFSSVLLVMLIAALNVANLLLARLAERRRELTVRAALGSGRARLVRQVLTECLLLSAIGTSGGLLFAAAALRYFRFASPIELTAGAKVAIDFLALLFTAGIALTTTLLFGLLPAIRASRLDLAGQLKAAARGALSGGLQHGAARSMIAVEMALSFVLLIGAGLLLRSAVRMGSEPLGFNPNGVLLTRTVLPEPRYHEPARRVHFYDTLLPRLSGLSGVAGAALAARMPPYASDGGNEALEIRGRPVVSGFERHDVGVNAVSPGFFAVLDIPLRQGRGFDPADRDRSLPVAIINDALVREYFPGTIPLGKQVRIAGAPGSPMEWLTIVGVVGDLKHSELMNEMSWVATPVLYRALSQAPPQRIEIAVRASAAAHPLEHEIQRQISALDGSVPINPVETVDEQISKALAYPRFRAVILTFFSIAALLLCAVGLHGVLSQLVAQRTPEFGLRKAIGAQPRDLLLQVARQGGIPVLAGMASGIGATFLFSRLLASLLYGIQPADPEVLAWISVVFLSIAGIAIAIPAIRAAAVDPMVALRDE